MYASRVLGDTVYKALKLSISKDSLEPIGQEVASVGKISDQRLLHALG